MRGGGGGVNRLGLGLGSCMGGMDEVGWLCVYWWVSGWVGNAGGEWICCGWDWDLGCVWVGCGGHG